MISLTGLAALGVFSTDFHDIIFHQLCIGLALSVDIVNEAMTICELDGVFCRARTQLWGI